jgi:hypothetical protein
MNKSFRVGWVEECWRSLFAEANATRTERNNPTFLAMAVGLSPKVDASLVLRATQPTDLLTNYQSFGC